MARPARCKERGKSYGGIDDVQDAGGDTMNGDESAVFDAPDDTFENFEDGIEMPADSETFGVETDTGSDVLDDSLSSSVEAPSTDDDTSTDTMSTLTRRLLTYIWYAPCLALSIPDGREFKAMYMTRLYAKLL